MAKRSLGILISFAIAAWACGGPTVSPGTPARTEVTPAPNAVSTNGAATPAAVQSPAASPLGGATPSPAPSGSLPPGPDGSRAPKPNVVLIVLDDISYLGDEFFARLPNFKEIFLDHGLSFRQADGNDPLCCPARASILTGLVAHKHGVVRNDARLFDPSVSLATELHAQGYYTLFAGKYFNKTNKLSDKTPPGWDQTAVMSCCYYRTSVWVNGRETYLGTSPSDYSTDFLANTAMEFLKSAPSRQPIFAYLAPYATHAGADERGVQDHFMPVPAPRHRDDPRCSDVPRHKLANFDELDVSDKPAWVRGLPRLGSFYSGGYPLKKHCRTLLSIDEQIGKVAEELRLQGRFDNTLWLVIGDNGWASGENRWLKKSAPYATQTMLYASWPLGIGTTPKEILTQVSHIDLAPTICELAGCEMGPFPRMSVDGQSFAGLLASSFSSSVPNREAMVIEDSGGAARIPTWRGLKTTEQHPLGLWLYVEYSRSGEKELYDVSGGPCYFWRSGMRGDPCRLKNLAGKTAFADIQRQLAEQLREMW